MPQPHSNPASSKNEEVRNYGRQIEKLEDERDAAADRGEDTSALDQQIEALEQQQQQAKDRRKASEAQARADRKAEQDPGSQGGDQE
jgi:hypothetical protein